MRPDVVSRALIGGNVEFATLGGATLPPIISGAPLRIVLTAMDKSIFFLYVKPEIERVEDLKGKRVAAGGAGIGPDFLLAEVLRRHGLEPGRDVAFIATGGSSVRYASLSSGTADAAILSAPLIFTAQEQGFRDLISFAKEGFVELNANIVVRENTLSTDPLLIESFLRATLKAHLSMRQNRAATIRTIARVNKIKEDLAAKIYDTDQPNLTGNGAVSPALQVKALEPALKLLGLKKAPPLGTVFDYSMVEKISTDLRKKGWKP
jgi:ABC-type nitrate/sulfonate/bicarbonate transport system substrate-binding protein